MAMGADAARRRRAAERRGRRAETLAAWLLRLKGFRILGRRVRTRFGEIDLVARRGSLVVICEVKARADAAAAAEAIAPRQQARLARAAAAYLQRHPALQACGVRFDAILIVPRARPRHVPGAWSAD